MISYAYDPKLRCPECECDIQALAWVIIDSREQPAAWVKCQKDTIHSFRCIRGHPQSIHAPLLLHDSTARRLFYSGAPLASPEQAQREFTVLVQRAWNALPGEIRQSLKSRLKLVPRELLALAVAGAEEDVIEEMDSIYQATSAQLHPGEEEERIAAIQYALELFRREDAPMLWATLAGRLSESIRLSRRGDPEDNLDEAMRIRLLILQELMTHDEPLRVAIAEMNLGVMFRHLPSTPESRRNALEFLRDARQVFRPRLFPQYCAVVCNNLALQYFLGDPADLAADTEGAIEALLEGITVLTPEADPKNWGDLHQHLGIAYYRRVEGDAADNIERSIAAYQQALRTRTQRAVPREWVHTRMDLAKSIRIRVKGDRAENIEQAIEIYHAAAEFAYQQNFLWDWARLQYDLADAYLLRIRGDPKENAEKAIAAGYAALQQITREFHPHDWGNIQQNLGNAYRELAHRGRPEFWDKSIEAYRCALSVRSPEKSRADWLASLDSLAGAYEERGEHEQESESLATQIDEALAAGPAEVPPRVWAAFLVNAGTSYSERPAGEEAKNSRLAIEAFRAAVEISTRFGMYEILRRAVPRLALVRERTAEWEESYAELSTTKTSMERTYAYAVSEEGKEATADWNWFLYEHLAFACLRTGRTREAFLNAEEGNARVLRDELARLPIPAPEVPQSLLEEESTLLQGLRAADLALRRADEPVERAKLIDELEDIHDRLNRVWDEMAKNPDAAYYVNLRRGEPLRWEGVQAWLLRQPSATGLVKFVELSKRWVAFIIRPGEAEPRIAELDLGQGDLLRFAESWTDSLREQGTLGDGTDELSRLLLSPIAPHLVGLSVACIVVHGLLHYVPIHALPIEGQPLVERMVIRYAPSVAAAMQDRARLALSTNSPMAVAGNPTCDLPFAEIEAAAIARRFHCTAVLRDEAKAETVIGLLLTSNAAHIAAHAWFDEIDPLASGILLAGRTVLDARRAMQENLRLQLLVLSACSTGQQSVGVSNSISGLARGFLYAGVRELVLSLWPVNDLSTMLLMDSFYSGLEQGLTTGEALRAAQIELRAATNATLARRFAEERRQAPNERLLDERMTSEMWRRFALAQPEGHPFEHAHYWAPFFVTGIL
jgi:CHAT domain-containing protein